MVNQLGTTINDILLPESALRPLIPTALDLVPTSQENIAIDLTNEQYGTPLLYYLIFTHWPYLLGADNPIDEMSLFYNRYYWFRKCANVYQSINGYDAGFEQQADQPL